MKLSSLDSVIIGTIFGVGLMTAGMEMGPAILIQIALVWFLKSKPETK